MKILDNKVCKIVLLVLGCISLFIAQIFTGPVPYALATVFPLFFLLVTRQASGKKELIKIGALFGIFYIARFYGFFGMPVADIVLLFLFGVIVYLSFVVDYIAFKKKDSIVSTIAFPLAYLTIYSLAYFIRSSPAMRLDFYWADVPIVSSSFAVFGGYGFTFCLLFAFSLVTYAISKKKILPGIIAVLVCALVVGLGLFGESYTEKHTVSKGTVKVAYVAGDYYGDFLTYESPDDDEDYENLKRELAACPSDADMLVFTEEAFFIEESSKDKFISLAEQTAIEKNLYIMLTLSVAREGEKEVNQLYWISPDGEVVAEYTKYCTIPLIETLFYDRGTGEIASFTATINGVDINISSIICFDGDFPLYITRASDDTDWFIIPSWDWIGVEDFHKNIQSLNPIENGVTLFKPTFDGYSIAVSPSGELMNETHTRDTDFGTVNVMDIEVSSTDTFYDSIGPWTWWICPIIFGLLGVWTVACYFKKKGTAVIDK